MVRRSIAFLAMIGFVASQLAAMPHAHEDCCEDHRHDARPHFHWGSTEAEGHGCSDAHDHCAAGRNVMITAPEPAHDHDCDAVMVLDSSPPPKWNSLPIWNVVAWDVWHDCVPWTTIKPAIGNWQPPEKVLDGSDRYLTLRTLRI